MFGNEDVDLRQLPLNQAAPPLVVIATEVINKTLTNTRPPTPPPPIISTTTFSKNDSAEVDIRKNKEVKQANPHFEALRAKLANATKMSGM